MLLEGIPQKLLVSLRGDPELFALGRDVFAQLAYVAGVPPLLLLKVTLMDFAVALWFKGEVIWGSSQGQQWIIIESLMNCDVIGNNAASYRIV